MEAEPSTPALKMADDTCISLATHSIALINTSIEDYVMLPLPVRSLKTQPDTSPTTRPFYRRLYKRWLV